MSDENQIAVTIDPDQDIATVSQTISIDEPTQPTEKTSEKPADHLSAELERIKAVSEANQHARRVAEQRAQAATNDAQQAQQQAALAWSQTLDTQVETIETGLSAAKGEADAAERDYTVAMDAGDYASAAKAQRKLASAEARAVQLEQAKVDFNARKASFSAAQQQQPRQREQVDPIENYISGPIDARGTRRTQVAQEWLRSHKEYITDPKKNSKLIAAHYNAVGEGHGIDSPEYYDEVEKFIGLKKNGDDQQKSTNQQRRSSAPMVAPVSGSSGSSVGGVRQVTLTKREADSATDGTHVWNYDDPSPQKRFKRGDPIGVQEFARRKSKMIEEGYYDKGRVEQ